MGFLSSLFQTGAPVQQVAGPTIATQKLPEELAPYYKDILGKAQALYNERTKEGFQPYQGPTIADFTPEQQQAFTGLQGLVGSQAPVFQEGMDLTRAAAAPMTSEQMTQYMSPYQQAVTDIEKREATKQYESQVVPQLAAKAATTGGFGGSRQAILEGMAADTQQRLLSDIQAKGSQQAYQDAVKRFQADRTAAGQAGAQLATMAPQQFKAQLGELGAIQTVGEQQQRQQQTALDEAFRQYQLERNYPYDTMSRYQSVVTGAPIATTQFAQPAPPAPSTAQTLLGGLGTLVGTYGAFGGKLPNVFGAKQGGGLNSIPVVYAANGSGNRSLMERITGQPQEGVLEKITGGFKKMVGGVTKFYDENMNLLNFPDTKDEVIATAKNVTENVVDTAKNVVDSGKNIISNIKIDGTKDTKSPQEAFFQIGDRGFPGKPGRSIVAPPTLYGNDPLQKIKRPESHDPSIGTYGQDPRRWYTADGVEFYDHPGVIVSDPKIPSIKEEEKKSEGIKDLIPEYTLEDSRLNALRARDAIKDIDKRVLTESRAKDEADIAAAEKRYLDAAAKQKGKLDEREAGLTDQKNQEQWANVASFFARLGSASPRKGGIMGVVDVALQEAPETIEAMGKTNAKIKATREDIEDKKLDLETILRKEELGMKLSAVERREKNRIQDMVETNTEKLYDLEVQKHEHEIEIAGQVNDVKSGDINSLNDTIANMLGAKIGANGKMIGGKFITGENQPLINDIQSEALALLNYMGAAEYYTNPIGHAAITKKLNALITGKKLELKPGDPGYVEPTQT